MRFPAAFVAMTWVVYALCLLGALVCFFFEFDLAYGAFSWSGGATFTVLALHYLPVRLRFKAQPDRQV